jgi:hypothetical protein
VIEKIELDGAREESDDLDFMKLQISAMEPTWDNQEDEA